MAGLFRCVPCGSILVCILFIYFRVISYRNFASYDESRYNKRKDWKYESSKVNKVVRFCRDVGWAAYLPASIKFEVRQIEKDGILMKKCAGILLVMFGCLVVLSGCSEKEAVVTIPTGKVGESVTISAEESIPDKFPKSIPIAKGAEVQAALSGKNTITVVYDVKTSFNEVMQLYKGHYKSSGYTELQETIIEDSYSGSGMLNGNKLLVTISRPDPAATSVSLTYNFKE